MWLKNRLVLVQICKISVTFNLHIHISFMLIKNAIAWFLASYCQWLSVFVILTFSSIFQTQCVRWNVRKTNPRRKFATTMVTLTLTYVSLLKPRFAPREKMRSNSVTANNNVRNWQLQPTEVHGYPLSDSDENKDNLYPRWCLVRYISCFKTRIYS